MANIVPDIPPLLFPSTSISDTSNRIRNGAPVTGQQWTDMALALNWLRGHGATLVAGSCTSYRYASATNTIEFRSYVCNAPASKLLNSAVGRAWFVVLENEESTQQFQFTITFLNSSLSFTDVIDSHTESGTSSPQPYLFVESPAGTPVPDGTEIGFDIVQSSELGIISVRYVACYEIPLAVLQADDGVDVNTTRPNDPIYSEPTALLSIRGVHDRMVLSPRLRRGMFAWYNDDAVNITATSFPGSSNIFVIDPAVQARVIVEAGTTETVEYAILARSNGASTTGEVRVTATNGDTDTITINDTLGWYEGTISIWTDDPVRYGTDGGIRGGIRDTLRVEVRRVDGTSVDVFGFVVGNG